jgi:predicted metal-dependent peptidase
MTEHNGGTDHVTWRDLDRRTAELVTHREIDDRLKAMDQLRSEAARSVEDARTIAREQVLKHDEEKNNILAQAQRDRAEFVNRNDSDRAIEKASLEWHSALERAVAAMKADTEANSALIRNMTTQIRSLENAETKAAGSDKGNLALIVSIGIALLYIAAQIAPTLFGG